MTETPTLFDNPRAVANLPELSVSELAGGVKRVLEQSFERVRVRGEVSKPLYHSSGHLYFSLKDADAVIDATCWKARVSRLPLRLEDGMDVVVTGQVTSYAKSSKYQINVESVALAGEGALLKILQDRKERLQKEGLFDAARKKPLPRFPNIIGVITSPTGAVIKDILHRLENRYPCHVLLWPVAVQGDGAAQQVADAIAGMNTLAQKPDVIIVARGGGSLEDLMAFNEEAVVRAAAASAIPLISAVGHETDTTLIDYAASVRAPTPTAAAEIATPVRREIMAQLQMHQGRLMQSLQRIAEHGALRMAALARGLGDPMRMVQPKAQALDSASDALGNNTRRYISLRGQQAQLLAARLLHPQALVTLNRTKLAATAQRLSVKRIIENSTQRLERTGALLQSYSYQRILSKGFALVRKADGSVVTAAAQLQKNDDVTLTFSDGVKELRTKS